MRSTTPDNDFKRSLTASIRQRMKEDNLSIAALAERMGTAPTAVRRIIILLSACDLWIWPWRLNLRWACLPMLFLVVQ